MKTNPFSQSAIRLLFFPLVFFLLALIFIDTHNQGGKPQRSFSSITIHIPYDGLSSYEIEAKIIQPVEGVLSQWTEINQILSYSYNNEAYLYLQCNPQADLNFLTEEIQTSLQNLKENYFQRSGPIEINAASHSGFPSLIIVFNTQDFQQEENVPEYVQMDFIEHIKLIHQEIQTLSEVDVAPLVGGGEKTITISVDPVKCRAKDISLNQLSRYFNLSNINIHAGSIQMDGTSYSLNFKGEYFDHQDIFNSIVTFRNNIPVHLRDIADITFGIESTEDFGVFLTGKVICCPVYAKTGISSYQLSQKVKSILTNSVERGDIARDQYFILMDKAKEAEYYWNESLFVLILTLCILYLLVLLITGMRGSFLILITAIIPMGIALGLLSLMGIVWDVMVFLGVILGLGFSMAFSAYYVYLRMDDKANIKEFAQNQYFPFIIFIVLSLVLLMVSLFILIIPDREIFDQMIYSFSLYLILSLLFQIFLLPHLFLRYYKRLPEIIEYQLRDEFDLSLWERARQSFYVINRVLGDGYENILLRIMHNRGVVIAFFIAISLLLVGVALEKWDGLSLHQPINYNDNLLALRIYFPDNTGDSEMDEIIQQVEELLMNQKSMQVQQGEDYLSICSARNVNQIIANYLIVKDDYLRQDTAQLFNRWQPSSLLAFIRLIPNECRNTSVVELMNSLREDLIHIPGIRFSFITESQFYHDPKTIQIRITGNNHEAIEEATFQLDYLVRSNINGIMDISSNITNGIADIEFIPNRQYMDYYGFGAADLGTILQMGFRSMIVSKYLYGDTEIPIRVVIKEEYRNDLNEIGKLSFRSPLRDNQVYLDYLLETRIKQQESSIFHLNQERMGLINLLIKEEVDMDLILHRIKTIIQAMDFGSAINIEIQDPTQIIHQNFIQQMIILGGILLLLWVLLFAFYKNLFKSLSLMVVIIMGLTGVMAGIIIVDIPWNIFVYAALLISIAISLINGMIIMDWVEIKSVGHKQDFTKEIDSSKIRKGIGLVLLSNILIAIPLVVISLWGSGIWDNIEEFATIVGLALIFILVESLLVIPVIYLMLTQVYNRIRLHFANLFETEI